MLAIEESLALQGHPHDKLKSRSIKDGQHLWREKNSKSGSSLGLADAPAETWDAPRGRDSLLASCLLETTILNVACRVQSHMTSGYIFIR